MLMLFSKIEQLDKISIIKLHYICTKTINLIINKQKINLIFIPFYNYFVLTYALY